MRSKFAVGDKVYVNEKAPHSVELARKRPRTVVEIVSASGRYFYKLGSNGRGASADQNPQEGYGLYLFRADMLSKWNVTGVTGRPRKRRKYKVRRRKAI